MAQQLALSFQLCPQLVCWMKLINSSSLTVGCGRETILRPHSRWDGVSGSGLPATDDTYVSFRSLSTASTSTIVVCSTGKVINSYPRIFLIISLPSQLVSPKAPIPRGAIVKTSVWWIGRVYSNPWQLICRLMHCLIWPHWAVICMQQYPGKLQVRWL